MKTIRNEFLNVTINEKGAELTSIQDMEGHEYLWQGDAKYWSGQAPNLFPYIARLTEGKYTFAGETYEMNIHGFARHTVFQTEQPAENKIVFTIQDTEETRKQYPFAFAFSITYALEGNALSVAYSVKNQDDKIMYFGVGGHPGFCVPMEDGVEFEDYYLEFNESKPAKRVGFSEDCFVTGDAVPFELEDGVRLPLHHAMFDDDAIVLYDMASEVTLKSDKGSKSIRVTYPDMPYLGFWHKPKTDAPYICIEPWSSLPSRKNVIEDFATQPSLLSLEQGEEYRSTIKIEVLV